jgi:PKD repeat protein
MTARADILVGGSLLTWPASSKSFTTNASGRGTVVTRRQRQTRRRYPHRVTLAFTPVGTNFANADPRSVEIRLVRPNAVPSSADLQALFTSAPTAPALGDAVAFDASNSKVGPGRTSVGFAWTFGDGATGSGKHTTHIFTHAGSAAVTLTTTAVPGRTASHDANINPRDIDRRGVHQCCNERQLFCDTFDASTSATPTGRTIVS